MQQQKLTTWVAQLVQKEIHPKVQKLKNCLEILNAEQSETSGTPIWFV